MTRITRTGRQHRIRMDLRAHLNLDRGGARDVLAEVDAPSLERDLVGAGFGILGKVEGECVDVGCKPLWVVRRECPQEDHVRRG